MGKLIDTFTVSKVLGMTKGIGYWRRKDILRYMKDSNKPFTDIRQVSEVRGIGEKLTTNIVNAYNAYTDYTGHKE